MHMFLMEHDFGPHRAKKVSQYDPPETVEEQPMHDN